MLNRLKQDKKRHKQISWCHLLQTQQSGITASLASHGPGSHTGLVKQENAAGGHEKTAAQIQSERNLAQSGNLTEKLKAARPTPVN